MKLNLYSVLDTTSKLFLPPFAVRTEKEAIEAFSNAVNQSDSIWKKYPQDYALVRICSFDDESGLIEQPEIPQIIISADKVLSQS